MLLVYSLEIRFYFIESNRTKEREKERERDKKKEISEHKKKMREEQRKIDNLNHFLLIRIDLHFTCNTSTIIRVISTDRQTLCRRRRRKKRSR